MGNIKSSFALIGKEFKNFNQNDKCLLNAKFEIKKKFKKNSYGILIYNKIKYKTYIKK